MADSPTIARIETILVDLPTIRPHRLAMTTMNRQTLMLVRIFASDGVEGLGEGTTIGGLAYGPESPEGMKLAIDLYCAPVLIGRRADRPAAAMAALAAAVKGNAFARCAIETALLDAQARRLGVPVSELVGGRLRERLPVAWTLASGETDRDIDEAERMLASGRHSIFKLKIGHREPHADIAHVAAIKRALGERASVRVDVNQAWSEAVAARAIPALADAGCDLVEQPVPLAQRGAMARLTGVAPIPVMADEAVQGPEAAQALAEIHAANVFALKIAQSGGLRAAGQVAAIADAAGIDLYGGTMLEGGIGTAASAQLFSTLPRLGWGTELFGPLLLTEDILAEPLTYADGHLAVPDGPGLGIILDEDRLRHFRRDRPGRTVKVVTGLAMGG